MGSGIAGCVYNQRESENRGEANRIEREALEDPFLYEALEGFSVLDADHEMVIKDLQRRIRGKAHRRTGRFVWFGWVAAMITIGWWRCGC